MWWGSIVSTCCLLGGGGVSCELYTPHTQSKPLPPSKQWADQDCPAELAVAASKGMTVEDTLLNNPTPLPSPAPSPSPMGSTLL